MGCVQWEVKCFIEKNKSCTRTNLFIIIFFLLILFIFLLFLFFLLSSALTTSFFCCICLPYSLLCSNILFVLFLQLSSLLLIRLLVICSSVIPHHSQFLCNITSEEARMSTFDFGAILSTK